MFSVKVFLRLSWKALEVCPCWFETHRSVLDVKHAGQEQGGEMQNSTHASVATGCHEINFALHRFFLV